MNRIRFSNGVEVLNVTPYTIVFLDNGREVVVPVSGVVISAEVKEEEEQRDEGFTVVTKHYSPTTEGLEQIRKIKREHPDVVLLGTSKAAEAYDGNVYTAIPLKEYSGRIAARRHDTSRFQRG